MLAIYIITVVIILFIIKQWKKYKRLGALYDKMPGETDFSYIAGTMHHFPGNNEAGIEFGHSWANKCVYFHRVWVGPFHPVLVLHHPDAFRIVLKSSAPKPRFSYFLSPYDMGIRWLGEGLLLANGAKWARSRKLITPAFHFDILKPYMDVYNQTTDVMISKMLEACHETKQSFDLYPFIHLAALDVILQCAFSYKSDCQINGSRNEYADAITELQVLWADRCLTPYLYVEFIYSLTKAGKRFYQLCDIAHRASEELIEKRKKEIEADPDLVSKKKVKDFLDVLLTARDEEGHSLSALDIRNEADTFLFEGHDTTASGMTWTLYALAEHPQYQARVYNEIKEVLGDRQDVLWSDLPKLEYTTMCIKEALRHHCAIPLIERTTSEECVINGYTVPKGTRVTLHIWLSHHNVHVWERPHEFLPERFHPDKQKDMDPFQYVPFSAGARNCIGQNFAMNEMKTMVAKVIQRFELRVDSDRPVARAPAVTLKSTTGNYVYATPR